MNKKNNVKILNAANGFPSFINNTYALDQPSKKRKINNGDFNDSGLYNDQFINPNITRAKSVAPSTFLPAIIHGTNGVTPATMSSENVCCICYEGNTGRYNLHCQKLSLLVCLECLLQFFYLKLSENDFDFKCIGCDGKISLEDVELFLMEHSRHEKKDNFISKLKKKIYTNQLMEWKYSIIYCPIPDCQGIFAVAEESLNETSFVNCDECKKKICLHCKEEFHANFTCKQREEFLVLKNEEGKLVNEYKQKNVKSCPKCKVEIEKSFGCDHITCTLCKYEFCFSCGKEYYDGHMREHYTPTRNNFVRNQQMLQLAQLNIAENQNQIQIPVNVVSLQKKYSYLQLLSLFSQKPFIFDQNDEMIFVLSSVSSYMFRKLEILSSSILDLEKKLNLPPEKEEDFMNGEIFKGIDFEKVI